MTYGIIINNDGKRLFDWINKRPICNACQQSRREYLAKDKKGNDRLSNLIPGFSSAKIEISVDLMVIAEAHGGGREEGFRKQYASVTDEVELIADYYRNLPLTKFHQAEMRSLFNQLDSRGKNWVFTDLIKCFVWNGRDYENDLKGNLNRKTAIKHCRQYLDYQITTLKPKQIIVLGRTVAKEYFNWREPKHGDTKNDCNLIYSTFPSRNTADIWVEAKGWEWVMNQVIP